MKQKIQAIHCTKNSFKPIILDIDPSDSHDVLPTYYRLTECDRIDIASRIVGGVNVSIVVDDEGLYKDETFPTVLTFADDGTVVEVLVGSSLIVKYVDDEVSSLTDDEVKSIMATKTNVFKTSGELYKVLVASIAY